MGLQSAVNEKDILSLAGCDLQGVSESERQIVKFRIKFTNTLDVTADEAIGEATDADIKKASLLMSRWTGDDLTLLVEFDTDAWTCIPILPGKQEKPEKVKLKAKGGASRVKAAMERIEK